MNPYLIVLPALMEIERQKREKEERERLTREAEERYLASRKAKKAQQ